MSDIKNKHFRALFLITFALLIMYTISACALSGNRISAVENKSPDKIETPLLTGGKAYTQHQWTTEFPPLVAHAGGGLRYPMGTLTYTNSYRCDDSELRAWSSHF